MPRKTDLSFIFQNNLNEKLIINFFKNLFVFHAMRIVLTSNFNDRGLVVFKKKNRGSTFFLKCVSLFIDFNLIIDYDGVVGLILHFLDCLSKIKSS